jgi:phosphoglycolate phosphatase
MPLFTNTHLPRSIVFDLDGTLVDTALDLTAALNHTLVKLDRPQIAVERVRHLVGHGARRLIERGLGEAVGAAGPFKAEDVEAGVPIFLDYYRNNLCVYSKPYPGAVAVLHDLRSQGVKLGICTNKPFALSQALVEALGLSSFFDAHLGGDSLPMRKPDPIHLLSTLAQLGQQPKDSVFIGDSSVDVQTAKSAGVRVIAVRFGFADQPVETLGADAILDHYAQLHSVLASLHRVDQER